MSKLNSSDLTKEEIEEELINDDLINSGGVEDQAALQQMDLEEKKNLLRGIKQSKEDYHNETGTTSRSLKKPIIIDTSSSESRQLKNPIVIDTSSTEFPSLAAAAKLGNKLKLPRRQSSASKSDTDNSSDQCITLLEDDDESLFVKPKKFSLPFCVSDNAPPLPMPDRAFRREKCPYYQLKGEHAVHTLRRILAHHESWKDKYNAETRKIESRALVENIQDFDSKELKNDENSDSENDPYTFTDLPSVTKVYNGPGSKKRDTNKSLDNTPLQSSRTLQRRTSRDSDCEEVQPIHKPDEPKLNDWITTTRPRNKRNRKQISTPDRAQSQTDVEFDFDQNRSLWGSARSPQSPAPARRSIPMPSVPEVQEEKVQCPICQRDFTLSTVENHAATCEGFSSSPMDVEEGP